MTATKIFIADDHPVVLQGLETILRDQPNVEICGLYRNGEDLLKAINLQQPDVLLLDVQMPGKQGDELARILTAQYPDIAILALTNLDHTFNVRNMFSAGAKGYLLKSADRFTILEAIDAVRRGQQYLDVSLRRQMMDHMINGGHEIPMLTQREKEVLELVATEMTTKDIAKKLFLSPRTVENCRINLFIKLEVKNVAGLVKKGIQMGLIK